MSSASPLPGPSWRLVRRLSRHSVHGRCWLVAASGDDGDDGTGSNTSERIAEGARAARRVGSRYATVTRDSRARAHHVKKPREVQGPGSREVHGTYPYRPSGSTALASCSRSLVACLAALCPRPPLGRRFRGGETARFAMSRSRVVAGLHSGVLSRRSTCRRASSRRRTSSSRRRTSSSRRRSSSARCHSRAIASARAAARSRSCSNLALARFALSSSCSCSFRRRKSAALRATSFSCSQT